MTGHGTDLRAALGLGAVSGMRTMGGWAGLAARGRVSDRRLRAGLLLAAAGESLGDKAPVTPPRSDPPALAGRVVSGALAGRMVGGARGAGVGAAGALASTYVSERARAFLAAHGPLPDPALGVIEDAAVFAAATAFAGPPASEAAAADAPTAPSVPQGANGSRPAADPADDPAPDRPGPGDPTPDGPDHAHLAPEGPRLPPALRGLLAAAAGTAAMTAAQNALMRITGAQPSSAPADVGRTLLRSSGRGDVPRRMRPALNEAMHALYGTAWGLPLGLAVGSGSLSQRPLALGLGFGALVWGASLVELPLLGVAPVPWREDPGSLAPDLAFHLVYGTATAAIYGALSA